MPERRHRSQQQAPQCRREAASSSGKLAVSVVQPMVRPASGWGIATVQTIPVVGRGIATVQSALVVVVTFMAVVELSMVVTIVPAVVVVAAVAAPALHSRVQKRRTNCSRRLSKKPA